MKIKRDSDYISLSNMPKVPGKTESLKASSWENVKITTGRVLLISLTEGIKVRILLCWIRLQMLQLPVQCCICCITDQVYFPERWSSAGWVWKECNHEHLPCGLHRGQLEQCEPKRQWNRGRLLYSKADGENHFSEKKKTLRSWLTLDSGQVKGL